MQCILTFNLFTSMKITRIFYSSLPLIRPLAPKVTAFMKPNFRCTEMIKYY